MVLASMLLGLRQLHCNSSVAEEFPAGSDGLASVARHFFFGVRLPISSRAKVVVLNMKKTM
jgi:hypothetical protein